MQSEAPWAATQDAANVQSHQLRKPCSKCGGTHGRITEKGAQDCVFCIGCGAFQYNAPRVETGKAVRSVTTVHNGIKPKQRMRLLAKSGGRCEICGERFGEKVELHAGHIVSVQRGLEMGLTELELNDDENLLAMCGQCNLGLGSVPLPLKLLVNALMARLRRERT